MRKDKRLEDWQVDIDLHRLTHPAAFQSMGELRSTLMAARPFTEAAGPRVSYRRPRTRIAP